MWCDLNSLQEAAELSMDHPKISALMREWNEERDWGLKDQLLCQIMNHVKELKASGDMTPSIVHLDEPIEYTIVDREGTLKHDPN